MATVSGMTVEKIESLVSDSLISAAIDENTGVLTLTTRDGQTITAGKVGSTNEAVDKAYPVGAIFMSTIATDPRTQLGIGTWQAWGTGRVPVGVDTSQTEFNTVGKTGGEKTHTLTEEEMPRHTHPGAPHTHPIDHDHADATRSMQYAATTSTGGTATRVTDVGGATNGGGTSVNFTINIPQYNGSSGQAVFTGETGNAGGNDFLQTNLAHNNLQPYITCYMWKRTG